MDLKIFIICCFQSNSNALFSFTTLLTARNTIISWTFVLSGIIFGILYHDVVICFEHIKTVLQRLQNIRLWAIFMHCMDVLMKVQWGLKINHLDCQSCVLHCQFNTPLVVQCVYKHSEHWLLFQHLRIQFNRNGRKKDLFLVFTGLFTS